MDSGHGSSGRCHCTGCDGGHSTRSQLLDDTGRGGEQQCGATNYPTGEYPNPILAVGLDRFTLFPYLSPSPSPSLSLPLPLSPKS